MAEETLTQEPVAQIFTCLSCSSIFTDDSAKDGVCSSCQNLAQKLAFVPDSDPLLETPDAMALLNRMRGDCYLPVPVIRHVVTLMACFTPAHDIARFIKFRYKQPTTAGICLKISVELNSLVLLMRDKFERHPVIPIAHLSFRLRKLQDLLDGTVDPKVKKDALQAAHDMVKHINPEKKGRPKMPSAGLSERL